MVEFFIVELFPSTASAWMKTSRIERYKTRGIRAYLLPYPQNIPSLGTILHVAADEIFARRVFPVLFDRLCNKLKLVKMHEPALL